MPETTEEKKQKKSPLCFLFAGCALYGGYKLIEGLFADLMYLFVQKNGNMLPSKGISIGIIGGVDGPTAVFVTTPVWTYYLIPALLLIAGVVGYLWLCKRKRK